MPLKGSRFESREDIMKNATAQLVAIPNEDFQKCFQQWKCRWVKCVESQGDYSEGDYNWKPTGRLFFPLAYGRLLFEQTS
jgi:hypothetical protein